MYSKVHGVTIAGIEAVPVTVEIDVGPGIPYFDMTGVLAAEVKEAKERVKAAIKNSGIELRPQRIVVNISPADIRKSGTGLDLPIAVGLVAAHGVMKDDEETLNRMSTSIMLGELCLDGALRGVKGVLSCVMAAKEAGFVRCIVPIHNIEEASCIEGIEVLGAAYLWQVIDYMEGCGELVKGQTGYDGQKKEREYSVDFSDVRGQEVAKRATLIAVAGMHNIMYVGAPGSGKTMMAMRIPTIMPDMSNEEMLELTRIYSVAGLLDKDCPRVTKRPFRNPHHSVTRAALLGGGSIPKPGEITLAHRGVLFLDEFTEYPPVLMENLRQPLEDRKMHINRMSGDYEYPADFMLVAAINPCQCGYYPDRNRCNCSEQEIKRYLGRISRPLWDRFDINVHVEPIEYKNLSECGNSATYNSKDMKEAVAKAHVVQRERFKDMGIIFNSQMNSNTVLKLCRLGAKETELMEMAYARLKMTVRGYHKVLKVARTIADIEGEERILVKHLSEAISFRCYVDE